jgi:hypothetical protein
MKDRPILFSAPMVRAIVNGTKTQTRRVVKPRKDPDYGCHLAPSEIAGDEHQARLCPYGKPGDRLWVRETWNTSALCLPPISEPYIYAADLGPTGVGRWAANWKPSIHMPRAASRISLDIIAVRVERLQDISRDDALAEGIVQGYGGFGLPDGSHFHAADPRISYWSLWDAINGQGATEANPWVWAVSFNAAVSGERSESD